ncbi:KICSTOR complex protein ITFG2 [Varanus komodoensis]|nr:KICSTOR complex protein ITFG2 [Varanus komodoensis]
MGLPLKTVRILQMMQNRAARMLTGTGHYSHITPVLYQLCWLPIEVRAQFKELVITYKALNGLGPGYLKERLLPYLPSHPVRSAADTLLREPSGKDIRRQSTRKRAFSAVLRSKMLDQIKTFLFQLTCVGVGDVCNKGKNLVVAVSAEGWFHLFDFTSPTKHLDALSHHEPPAIDDQKLGFKQHIPANTKVMLINDIGE